MNLYHVHPFEIDTGTGAPSTSNVELTQTQYSFKCIYEGCTSSYHLTNILYDHIRTHKEFEEKPSLCPYCSAEFKSMSSMVYHVRTHSQEQPYICPIASCNYRGTIKSALKGHLLSEKHKAVMTLGLLNKVLHFDTKRGKNEKSLITRKRRNTFEPNYHQLPFKQQRRNTYPNLQYFQVNKNVPWNYNISPFPVVVNPPMFHGSIANSTARFYQRVQPFIPPNIMNKDTCHDHDDVDLIIDHAENTEHDDKDLDIHFEMPSEQENSIQLTPSNSL